jgi:hypothetical protein
MSLNPGVKYLYVLKSKTEYYGAKLRKYVLTISVKRKTK